LADYQATREDDRTFATATITSTSIAAGLLGLIGAGLTQVCAVKGIKAPATGPTPDCANPPDLFLGLAPMAPVAIAATMIMAVAVATVRSYYIRALERELRDYSPEKFKDLGGVGPGSYTTLLTEITSLRRGRPTYRLLANFSVATVIVVFGGMTWYIGTLVDRPTQILMASIYTPAVLLLSFEFVAATVGGRGLFIKAATQFNAELNRLPKVPPKRAPDKQRSLVGYLFWPRPADWIKALVAPGIYLITAYAHGSFERWHEFLTLFLILEYLIYESRYQWNDLRGWAEDKDHVERRSRARLPVANDDAHNRRNIMASVIVALLRLVGAVAVGQIFGLLAETLLLIGLVYAIAFVYERLRAVAQPIRAHPSLVTSAIWLVVGLGYAVRAGVGIAFAGIGFRTLIGASGLVFFAAFGSMFVLLTWVLEAAALSAVSGDTSYETEELLAKPHLAPLLGYVSRALRKPESSMHELRSGRDLKVAAARGAIIAPWNLAFAIAAAAAGIFGLALTQPLAPTDWIEPALSHVSVWFLMATSAILFAGGLMLMPGTGTRWLAFLIGAAGMQVAALALGTDQKYVAAAPWAVVGLWYVFFRQSSYRDLNHPFANVVVAVVGVGAAVAQRLVGRQTWNEAQFPDALTALHNRMLDSDDVVTPRPLLAGPSAVDQGQSIRRPIDETGADSIDPSARV